MPYAPTVWTAGDEVTSARMNKVESGLAAATAAAEAAQAGVDNLTAIVNSLGTGTGGGSGSTVSSTAGAVSLWSFAGSTPDAKLTNALSYAAAQTVTTPPILISPDPAAGSGSVSFGITRTLFNGCKIVYPYGFGNQQRGAESIPCDVRYTGGSSWWVLPAGNTYDVEFAGFGAQGNSGSTFLDNPNGGVLWTSKLHDLGFNLWKHVLGSLANKLLVTACLFNGWWNINNSYNTAVHIGGSDSQLFLDGMLIDSPTTIMGTSTPGNYHMWLDYLEKSEIGGIYMTAEKVSGIRISGGSTTSGLVLNGQGRVEGRNINQPTWGANMLIEGGVNTIRDWWIAYGLSNPNQNGHANESGVITQTGGDTYFDGCMYDTAAGVSLTVPWISCRGGKVRVRNARTGSKGGAWGASKPIVQAAGGTIDVDSSVTAA